MPFDREKEDVSVTEQDDREAVLIAERIREKALNLRNDCSTNNHGD